ncbi:MAG TPA: inosine/xanthosine triphosphatase [Brevefilum sp.]|nr:inosine/xanthosine triphosphatase [Brevefilum sp.]HPL69977.1 inosine/xanthosine triphosphatase [Brevefilum sp.]
MMKKIVIASHNPVKIEAVQAGFSRMFPGEDYGVESVSVDSGVGHQPLSEQVSREGAENRARKARLAIPEGDFWVGVEGGCELQEDEMISFAWVVVLSEERVGSSRTAHFKLPQEVKNLVEAGMELGDADDVVFGIENSKQKSGAVGLLTGDVVTRKTLYEQAVILALIPFKQTELY